MFSATAGALFVIRRGGQVRSMRGLAVCLLLAAICVGYNHGLSSGQLATVIEVVFPGMAAGVYWGR